VPLRLRLEISPPEMAEIERTNMGTTLGSGALWCSWWWCPSLFHQSQLGSAEANTVEIRITATSMINRFIDRHSTPSAVLVKTECFCNIVQHRAHSMRLPKRTFLATQDSVKSYTAYINSSLAKCRTAFLCSSARRSSQITNRTMAMPIAKNTTPPR